MMATRRSFGILDRLIAVGAFVAVGASVSAQTAPTLAITSPSSGVVVTAGSTFEVQLTVSGLFEEVGILTSGNLQSNTIRRGAPWTFSVTVPASARLGVHRITAAGAIEAGRPMFSPPIEVVVERSESPTAVKVFPQTIIFQHVGQSAPLRVDGTLPDGTHVTMTKSGMTTYTSTDQGVVNVSTEGVLVATGPGDAEILIELAGRTTTASVSVPDNLRGDLDGDRDVDVEDAAVVMAAMGTPLTTPLDARDLNGDGTIDASDTAAIIGLCTLPNCAVSLEDLIPPTTIAATLPAPNAAGWTAADVAIRLTSIDNFGGLGVAEISYTVSGAQSLPATTVAGGVTSVPITTDGLSTVSYFATDNAGNVEAARSVTVRVDKTLPVVAGTRTPLPNSTGWNNTFVTAAFACADAGSGLAPGSPPTATVVGVEGAGQSVAGTCADVAGNSSTMTISDINIDLTPPGLAGQANQTIDQTSPAGAIVNYMLPAATDALSGVASTTCLPTSGSLFQVGSTLVTCSATDRAGNIGSTTFVVTVMANRTPPGRIFGVGFIGESRLHRHFVLRVARTRNEDYGRLEYWVNNSSRCPDGDHDEDGRGRQGDLDPDYGRDHGNPLNRFEATTIGDVTFADDPGFDPGRGSRPLVDSVRFAGSGRWNGRPGYTFEASATDQGEPGRRRDTFSLVVRDGSGAIVASVSDALDGGNIQSIRVGR